MESEIRLFGDDIAGLAFCFWLTDYLKHQSKTKSIISTLVSMKVIQIKIRFLKDKFLL